MVYGCFILGLFLAGYDVLFLAKTLKSNITKRLLFIFSGIICICFIDSSYLNITSKTVIIGVFIGIIFGIIHLFISKGIKIKIKDINSGLIYTCFLIYFIELPAEEFLYRGILLITMLNIFNPIIAILISSIIFLILHIRTWNSKFIWIGSFILALTCSVCTYFTKSIWSAIIIHNLNNFAFLTLVNKRNIFQKSKNETMGSNSLD